MSSWSQSGQENGDKLESGYNATTHAAQEQDSPDEWPPKLPHVVGDPHLDGRVSPNLEKVQLEEVGVI